MCCIDQEDGEGKKIQIRHIDAIYDEAFLTIVAIEGRDPNAGLSRVRALAGNPAL
jgi:hypothetical protein